MKRIVPFVILVFSIFSFTKANAGVETIPTGSFIINMGISPQTYANGLKPYGLVYQLLKFYNVPVKWVINPSKSKDGTDFIHNSITYKGGAFIILKAYRTAAVNSLITTWQTKGVIGATTVSDFSVDVFQTMRFAPSWTLDKDNGNIALDYFINAEIPSTAHGGSSSSGWKTPAQLGPCDDIFVMPHADPAWSTHSNLYYWNQTYKGNIWAACHAVSVLENVKNPGLTIQMNFLSTTGLLLYGSHSDGSPAYDYTNNSDPVSQFMGTLDASTTNGSEQIFMPLNTGGWRPTTQMISYDPTQSNVPSNSPGPAAVAVYGRAYGDPTRGYVMYEGGHDHTKGTVQSQVAAQRAFFNYSFFATNAKATIDINMDNVPGVMGTNYSYPLNFTLPAGYSASQFKIKWTSSCGGTFSPSDTIQNPTFTPPNNPSLTECVISVDITDSCFRKNFNAKGVIITLYPLPLKLSDLTVKQSQNGKDLYWKTFTENQKADFEIQRSLDGIHFYTINTIESGGNENGKAYHYTDSDNMSGTIYYRIIATDENNKKTISNTVKIVVKENNGIGFSFVSYPNPVKDKITIQLSQSLVQQCTVRLINVNGVIVLQKNFETSTGNIALSGLEKINPGVYYLQVMSNGKVASDRIIISK